MGHAVRVSHRLWEFCADFETTWSSMADFNIEVEAFRKDQRFRWQRLVSNGLIAMKTYSFIKVVAIGAAIFPGEPRLESAKPNTRGRQQ